MCADMVEVCWEDPHGEIGRGTALLEDISTSGVCLQLEIPVPLGARIRWESRGHQFAGKVRYCSYREIGYFAGVELHAGCRWSPKTYRPRHLFDPRRLAGHIPKTVN